MFRIVNIFLPIRLSIFFGCSKEPSHQNGSFEYQQHMFLLRNKKVNFLLSTLNLSPAPGRVAQSVTCLATDASLTADSGVANSIPARSHTFMDIDHEIISMVILLPSAESFKKGCCQLQAKVCARSTG